MGGQLTETDIQALSSALPKLDYYRLLRLRRDAEALGYMVVTEEMPRGWAARLYANAFKTLIPGHGDTEADALDNALTAAKGE